MSASVPFSKSVTPFSPATSLSLVTPVQYVKGVGPQKAELLKKLDITTVEDLVGHFPRAHQNRRTISIRDARIGSKNAFLCVVQNAQFMRVGKSLGQYKAIVKDGTGGMSIVWFKHMSCKYDVFATLKKYVIPNQKILVFGEIEVIKEELTLKAEDYEIITEELAQPKTLVPVYPLTEGVQDRWLRTVMEPTLHQVSGQLFDCLPESIRAQQKLQNLAQAIRDFHFPIDQTMLQKARERLVFDEFFFLEMALAMNRQNREQSAKGVASTPTKVLLTPFKNKLKYEFTKAQVRVINEIFRDMGRPQPMNRLLQGDVGSGKTVVALSAALLAIENGLQVALLAPTEILAEQHAIAISALLADMKIKTAFLSGSTQKSDRKEILQKLEAGQIQFLLGTHALLAESVQFKNLGLVIIDEQHRFGVRQRGLLLRKSAKRHQEIPDFVEKLHPDVLCMTATPIPRTLAMTLYGDLDVSTIDEKPEGRVPIRTSMQSEAGALSKIREAVEQGEQAYLVFPVIEESEKLAARGAPVRAVMKEYEKLLAIFAGIKIGLLHGRMKAEEKKSVMDAFRRGELKILVATPVIEVGIDVPNATAIAIYNPERFGLAALHQLRGRVGRGQKESYCYLIAISDEVQNSPRLQTFCAVNDGFKLAEEDLRLRGPGEIMGESQHGVPFFKVANIVEDALMLARAREAAHQLVHGDVPLTMKEFTHLNLELKKRFGKNLNLSRVG